MNTAQMAHGEINAAVSTSSHAASRALPLMLLLHKNTMTTAKLLGRASPPTAQGDFKLSRRTDMRAIYTISDEAIIGHCRHAISIGELRVTQRPFLYAARTCGAYRRFTPIIFTLAGLLRACTPPPMLPGQALIRRHGLF